MTRVGCFPSDLACVVLFKLFSPAPLVATKTWLVAELPFASCLSKPGLFLVAEELLDDPHNVPIAVERVKGRIRNHVETGFGDGSHEERRC